MKDISVPSSASAGTYSGTFTITSSQGQTTVSLTLIVWNFQLPKQPYLQSSFEYNGQDDLTKENNELLILHRIMPSQIWNASDSQRLIDDFGMNIMGLPFWSDENLDTCTMDPAPSVSALTAAVNAISPNIPKYEYTADEITPCLPAISDQVQAWARNVHAAGAKVLITVPPDPSLADDGTGTRAAVDIYVNLPHMLVEYASEIASVQQQGYEAWSYTALVQDSYSPKWEIDFTPNNYRIFPGFMNQAVNLTGLLYWGIDAWSADPWNDPSGQDSNRYPGEGQLTYPGEQVGLSNTLLPSIRLKWLRDGVDDYDYIQLLKNMGQGDWAMSVVQTVAVSWSVWTQDSEKLEAARITLGNKLHELNTPGGTPPPTSAPTPTPSI
jgi:hypothetical protein